jgi:hypothetical protein
LKQISFLKRGFVDSKYFAWPKQPRHVSPLFHTLWAPRPDNLADEVFGVMRLRAAASQCHRRRHLVALIALWRAKSMQQALVKLIGLFGVRDLVA